MGVGGVTLPAAGCNLPRIAGRIGDSVHIAGGAGTPANKKKERAVAVSGDNGGSEVGDIAGRACDLLHNPWR
jgi:hypothetical protein